MDTGCSRLNRAVPDLLCQRSSNLLWESAEPGGAMGASGWSYLVRYQPDLNAALDELREEVFAEGSYWWAGGQVGSPASDYGDRPATIDELFDDEEVRQAGTHSILDMHRVLTDGEAPDYGTVEPVSDTEALQYAGTTHLTRDHIPAINQLARRSWFGRCAVLHNALGQPDEIYFWGYSGD